MNEEKGITGLETAAVAFVFLLIIALFAGGC